MSINIKRKVAKDKMEIIASLIELQKIDGSNLEKLDWRKTAVIKLLCNELVSFINGDNPKPGDIRLIAQGWKDFAEELENYITEAPGELDKNEILEMIRIYKELDVSLKK